MTSPPAPAFSHRNSSLPRCGDDQMNPPSCFPGEPRIDRPVEFGCKAQAAETTTASSSTSVSTVLSDGLQLAPAIDRVSRRAGCMSAQSPLTAPTASPPSSATCTTSGYAS